MAAQVIPFPKLAANDNVPLPGPSPIERILSRLDRVALVQVATAAIDLIDAIDGDPDLEEDDPAGGNVEDEGDLCLAGDYGCSLHASPGGLRWGSDHEGEADHGLCVEYGIDQTEPKRREYA